MKPMTHKRHNWRVAWLALLYLLRRDILAVMRCPCLQLAATFSQLVLQRRRPRFPLNTALQHLAVRAGS